MSFRLRTRPRRHRAGQGLIEIVLAIGLMGFAVMAILGGISVVSRVSDRVTQASETIASVDALADQLESSASSASAVFSPPLGANMTGLTFLQFDNSGVRHRWGYVYNSQTQTLTKCTQYSALATSDYDTTCTGVSSTRPISSFTVNQLSMTAQAAAFGLTAQNDVAIEMDSPTRDPSGVVVAGNAIDEVSLVQGTTARTIDLIQGGVPLSVGVIAHHNQAPAVGAITGPGTESVTTGGIVMGSFTEPNYGAYAPYLGAMGGWSVTACSGGSGGTAGVAVTGDSGNTSTITITGATPGTCTFDVVTEGQTFPVTVTISPIATPKPTASPMPTATATLSAGATSSPMSSSSPDPCAAGGDYRTCSPSPSPAASATPLQTCSTNFGQPTFLEPDANQGATIGGTAYASPSIADLYAQIDQPGYSGPSGDTIATYNERTPNGNTVYGFWDNWPSTSSTAVDKGAILEAENTDCSVTYMMVTFSEGTFPAGAAGANSGISGIAQFATVWPMPSPYYPVDTQSIYATGGGANQILCMIEQQGTRSGSFFADTAYDECDLTDFQGQNTFGNFKEIHEYDLQFLTPSEDRVIVPFHSGGGYAIVARWVLHPDSHLNILPVPEVGHAFGTCNNMGTFNPTGEDTGQCQYDEPYDYWEEGLGAFGTGPSSSTTTYSGGLVLFQP